MRIRVLATALALAVFAVGSPQVADAGSSGIIISRLELRGPVDADDAWMAYRSSSEPGAIIEPGHWLCHPESVDLGLPKCTAGVYETETPPLPVGSTVDYHFRRHPAGGVDFETHCAGTITVQEGSQTVTCVYDYGGAATPLPDTATEAPATTPWAVLSGMLMVGIVGVWSVALRRQGREAR